MDFVLCSGLFSSRMPPAGESWPGAALFRRRLVVFVAAIVVWAGLPSNAMGQDRRGFWIAAGVGVASIDASADDLDVDRGGGVDISLALGWTLAPQFLVGVELVGYSVTLTRSQQESEATDVDVVATLTYYPRQRSGFFVKAGAGPSFFNSLDDDSPEISGKGFAVMGGVGYDLYLGRNFSLVAGVDLLYGHIGDVEFDQRTEFRDWRHNLVRAAVSIKLN